MAAEYNVGGGPKEAPDERSLGFTATYAVSIFSDHHASDDEVYQLEKEFQASVIKDIESLIPGGRLRFENFRVDQGSISLATLIMLYIPATYAGYRICKDLNEMHELAEKIGEFVQHRIRFWFEKIYRTDYYNTDSKILTVKIDAPELERDLRRANQISRSGLLGGRLLYGLLRLDSAIVGWIFLALLGLLILLGGVKLWTRMDRLAEALEHMPRLETSASSH